MVGIPLERAGFHVVEVQSQKIPEQLNSEAEPAIVTTAVLKSNIAVHAKLGGDLFADLDYRPPER